MKLSNNKSHSLFRKLCGLKKVEGVKRIFCSEYGAENIDLLMEGGTSTAIPIEDVWTSKSGVDLDLVVKKAAEIVLACQEEGQKKAQADTAPLYVVTIGAPRGAEEGVLAVKVGRRLGLEAPRESVVVSTTRQRLIPLVESGILTARFKLVNTGDQGYLSQLHYDELVAAFAAIGVALPFSVSQEITPEKTEKGPSEGEHLFWKVVRDGPDHFEVPFQYSPEAFLAEIGEYAAWARARLQDALQSKAWGQLTELRSRRVAVGSTTPSRDGMRSGSVGERSMDLFYVALVPVRRRMLEGVGFSTSEMDNFELSARRLIRGRASNDEVDSVFTRVVAALLDVLDKAEEDILEALVKI